MRDAKWGEILPFIVWCFDSNTKFGTDRFYIEEVFISKMEFGANFHHGTQSIEEEEGTPFTFFKATHRENINSTYETKSFFSSPKHFV